MKKQDKEVLTIFVIIILVIVFMAIFLGVLAKPDEQHFKITKEVCEEIETYSEIGQVDTSLIVVGLEELPEIPKNATFSCPTNTNICRIIIPENITICEQVEVEKFEPCHDGSQPILLQRHSCNTLTTEWLDENAHCEDCSVGTTNEVGIKCLSKCSKYKIGNYTIEPW